MKPRAIQPRQVSQAVRDHMKRIDARRRWIRRLNKMRRRAGKVVGFAKRAAA